jgi:hypothetical protein
MFHEVGMARLVVLNYEAVEDSELPDSIYHFLDNFDDYYRCVDSAVSFLQGKDPSLALRIASRKFLPEGPQFAVLSQIENSQDESLNKAFGTLGVQDKAKYLAKYLATLFINDIAKVITEGVDPYFEVSRYAERLASSNSQFDDLYAVLQAEEATYTEVIIEQFIAQYLADEQPDVIGISVPFPGNMLGALQAAKTCKKIAPQIKIILGGGFINTELRSLKEARLFEFVDYICLDDGERPLLSVLEYLQGQGTELFRTYTLDAGQVVFKTDTKQHDFSQKVVGCPSYEGLSLDSYL